MEIGWIPVGKTPFTPFGSSCCIMDQLIYIIGGSDLNHHHSESVIRVAIFCPQSLQWKSKVINGNNSVNRSFHASTVCGSKIFTFGGSTSLGNVGEVMVMKLSSEEITCSTQQLNNNQNNCNISLKGLSASTLGLSNKLERIVLYGGITEQNDYVNESFVFDLPSATSTSAPEQLNECKISSIQIDSETPPPRAFHSAVVSGDNRQYLIIHGGRGRTGLLNDLWILDATCLFQTTSEPIPNEPKGKGAKPAKGASGSSASSSVALPFWCQVSLTSPPLNPRCLHSSFLVSSQRSFTLNIFGGVGDGGALPLHISKAEIIQESSNKWTATTTTLATTTTIEQENNKRFSFASCGILENDNPVAIFVFGGVQNLQNSLPELLILQENSLFSSNASSILQELTSARQAPQDDRVGHIEYPGGDIYDGEILKEEEQTYRHGRGKLSSADGGSYEGEWNRDIRHGTGRYTSSDGSEVYEGQYENNEYSGHGLLTLFQSSHESTPNRSHHLTYNGEFVHSSYHGQGTLSETLTDTTYTGQFQHGIRSGHGILMKTSTGMILYEGEWIDNIPCGYGTLYLEGGHVYTGQIQGGKPNGEGHCRYVDGSEYKGAWKSGKRNGYGSFIGSNLDEYKGKWVGDQRSGKGIWKSARGDTYEGRWDLDLPHDHGRVVYYLGENNNTSSPTTTISSASDPYRERVYDGKWEHGKRSGEGVVTYANGQTKKGFWNATTRDAIFNNNEENNNNY